MKKGDILPLRIDAAAYEGKGIGRADGLAVFVPGTAPGDLARVRIDRKKSNFAEGTLLDVLEPGPDRIVPRCSHASHCGGCTWQHVAYPAQSDFKRAHVRDHLHRIGGLHHIDPHPTLSDGRTFGYRNKMEYTFADRRWLTPEEIASGAPIDSDGVALGLHAPGRYDKVLDLRECHLQDPVSYALLDWLRTYAVRHGIAPYNPVKKHGFLRNLMVRNGQHTGDLMVNLVTNGEDETITGPLVDALLAAFPHITTVVQNVNDTPSPTSVGRYERVLFGPGVIRERLGPHTYEIGANAFFQTNTPMAERLYATAVAYADLRPTDHLVDLYCGVGSISMYASPNVRRVTGIELNPVSIRNAEANRDRNGVTNVEFVLGDVKDTFSDIPDVLITDPPRAGMHADVVARIAELRIPRIAYVSCNSSTMARDLALLNEVYETLEVQPVDMFPQTYHIECVAKLRLR